jgi:hypothetical protein
VDSKRSADAGSMGCGLEGPALRARWPVDFTPVLEAHD